MRKRRAVVIDGEESTVNWFKDIFCARQYEVLSYIKPVLCPIRDEKGDFAKTHYPCADVIITDFKMPHMNGLDLLEEQTRHGCTLMKENKAVISWQVDEESHRKIKQLGYAFFQKPIDITKFSAWLDECEKRMDLRQRLISRRKEIRHLTHYGVSCLVDRTGETVDGITVNISNSGLCLQLAIPLMIGQIIHIHTTHAVMACGTASVRWVRKKSDASYLAGLSCL